MEIDDMASVAERCAKGLHGDKAQILVAQNHPSYPPDKRWRASVIVRGDALDTKHGPDLSSAVKALATDLAARSRDIVAMHGRTAFEAAVLGL